MVGEAEASGTEFGIVLARDTGILNCGCTVVVEHVANRYPDGRFDILTRGVRRFVIESVNRDKSYLCGEVNFFDDEDLAEAPPALVARVAGYFEVLPEGNSADKLSFRLAAILDDLEFKSILLRSRSETQRLQLLAGFLAETAPRKAYEARMQRAAPTNGHGHKPPQI